MIIRNIGFEIKIPAKYLVLFLDASSMLLEMQEVRLLWDALYSLKNPNATVLRHISDAANKDEKKNSGKFVRCILIIRANF